MKPILVKSKQLPKQTEASWRNPDFKYVPIDKHNLENFRERMEERKAKVRKP